jgi:hypothetical protein
MTTKQVPYSSFLRGPADVLSVLEEADVVLERRDAESLVLTPVHRFEARNEGMAVAARALQEMLHRDPSRADEVMQASVSWLHWLPDDERRSCINELVLELEAGAATGNLEPFAGALRAWRSTAEVWSDPELARRLSRGFAGDGPLLKRPAAR